VVLLGVPAFSGGLGYRPPADAGIAAPDPRWGEHFQALVLNPDAPLSGRFAYAAPFDRL
jgi:putative acetyltransferase